MTAAERRRLLGDTLIAHIRHTVDEALTQAPPTSAVLDGLRPILTRPARRHDTSDRRAA